MNVVLSVVLSCLLAHGFNGRTKDQESCFASCWDSDAEAGDQTSSLWRDGGDHGSRKRIGRCPIGFEYHSLVSLSL